MSSSISRAKHQSGGVRSAQTLGRMRIRAPFLTLELEASGTVDEHDWGRVLVKINTADFSGEYLAWLQADDLERFARDLEALIREPSRHGTATLTSEVPDVEISLSTHERGAFNGRYRLHPDPPSLAVVLSGQFVTYQSFLPEIRRGVIEVLAALRGNNNAA